MRMIQYVFYITHTYSVYIAIYIVYMCKLHYYGAEKRHCKALRTNIHIYVLKNRHCTMYALYIVNTYMHICVNYIITGAKKRYCVQIYIDMYWSGHYTRYALNYIHAKHTWCFPRILDDRLMMYVKNILYGMEWRVCH